MRAPAPGAGGMHPGREELTDRERDVDVVVIGLGPGGEHAAGTLAQAGLSVAGVENSLVGGECPYWGCVPSKMMIRAADLIAEGHRIPGMAGKQAYLVHDGVYYDIEVDTTSTGAREAALAIAARVLG